MTLGYNMACGIGRLEERLCLAVRLQPLQGSPDPIDKDLFERIKGELETYLKDKNLDVPLDIKYVGRITAL